jgi:ubiquinone/menaquinone biosynthesis C-methylase UbiE
MNAKVKAHYNSNDLAQKIKAALIEDGKDLNNLTPQDLSAIDQLHTGGAKATLNLLKDVSFNEKSTLLDAGCGIGGTSRLLAAQLNCNVIGVDLADQFIEAGRFLTQATGLADKVNLQQGSILNLPFDEDHFDGIICQHVLMNIKDKRVALKEFYRVLKPRGKLILMK